jgi:hypothetical protein
MGDPLNLTRAMRTAYDFIQANGYATGAHPAVSEPTAQALRNRGLVEMYHVPTGHKNTTAWVVIPLGKPKPKKVELPHITVAAPATVSKVLGLGKDASDKPLVRARSVRELSSNSSQCGGYAVATSSTRGEVIVSYVTPDDMNLATVLRVRPEMLKRYAEVLRAAQYEVREDAMYSVLFVSK